MTLQIAVQGSEEGILNHILEKEKALCQIR